MATTLHSFMDIFDTTFGEGPEAVQLKKIIIPIIQRDYAQGRKGAYPTGAAPPPPTPPTVLEKDSLTLYIRL